MIADNEIRARTRRVQEELDRTGRAAVICFAAHRDYLPGDVRYLSRHSCTDEETAYVVVPRRGDSTLVIDAEWDLARARAEAYAGEIVLDRTPARAVAELVAACAGPGDAVGITGMAVFPAPVHQALLAAHPGIAFDDAGPMLDAIKLVKSEAEIALLREASRISDAGMRAGLQLVADVHEAARGSVIESGLGDQWWGYYMPHGAGTGQHELPAGLDDADLVLVLVPGHGHMHRAGRRAARRRRGDPRADGRGRRGRS